MQTDSYILHTVPATTTSTVDRAERETNRYRAIDNLHISHWRHMSQMKRGFSLVFTTRAGGRERERWGVGGSFRQLHCVFNAFQGRKKEILLIIFISKLLARANTSSGVITINVSDKAWVSLQTLLFHSRAEINDFHFQSTENELQHTKNKW